MEHAGGLPRVERWALKVTSRARRTSGCRARCCPASCASSRTFRAAHPAIYSVTPITRTEPDGGRPLSLQELNKEVVRQFYAALDAGNLDAMDQLVSADYIDHNPHLFRGSRQVGTG